nr:alpha-amylase domain-containing protein [Maliibacterium massiliense]
MGQRYAGAVVRDLLGSAPEPVTIEQDGWADFPVSGGAVSVYILPDAYDAWKGATL